MLTEQSAHTEPSFTEPSFTEPSSRDVADALFQAVKKLSLATAGASTSASDGKREECAELFRGALAAEPFFAGLSAESFPRSFRGAFAEPSVFRGHSVFRGAFVKIPAEPPENRQSFGGGASRRASPN